MKPTKITITVLSDCGSSANLPSAVARIIADVDNDGLISADVKLSGTKDVQAIPQLAILYDVIGDLLKQSVPGSSSPEGESD